MKASRNAIQFERRSKQDLQDQYKEELELIIKLKQNELQRTKDDKYKDTDQIAQSVKKCLELEERHLRFKRDRERMIAQESQQSRCLRMEELARQREEDERRAREHLRESMDLETLTLKARKEKQRQEIEGFKNHYQQTLMRKSDEKEEERQRSKLYSEEEKIKLEKMERENYDLFMQNVRNSQTKSNDVLEIYERLHASVAERDRAEYQRTVEKPVFEAFQKELEKERQELLARKQLKEENNNFVQEQIEENSQKKEIIQYEQAKLDYEMLVEDLERQDQADQEAKQLKKQRLLETLNTLKSQMKQKQTENAKVNFMNLHESRVNDLAKNSSDGFINPEEVGASIPGFVMPHERKRQLAVLEQSVKLNNQFLTLAMSSPLPENAFKSSNISRRKTFQPDLSKLNLLNKENFKTQPSAFVNDYQYNRHRNKNSTYDIISNNTKIF